MNLNNNNSISRDFTRGGQTFLHKVRMLSQIILRLISFIVLVFIITSLIVFIVKTSSEFRSILCSIFQAKFYSSMFIDHEIHLAGNKVAQSSWLLEQSQTHQLIKSAHSILLSAMIWGIGISVSFGLVGVFWLIRHGRKETSDKLLKGTKVVPAKKLKKMIKKLSMASDLEIGGVPIPKGSETTHMLIHGTVGTGKSVCLKSILDQIRKRGNKAIIYDKHGDFVKYFYREGKDILLNPLDARCAKWDLWRECEHPANFDSLAAGLIPLSQSSNDPFWINAARSIFSAAANKMTQDPDRTTEKLLQYLLMSDLGSIAELLKGTEAETLVSDKIAKTALSVKSVLATYLNPLKFLPRVDESYFSIREWIQDESTDSWLFITSRSDVHETLKPLISSWLDIAANSLMRLPENRDRRVWMILDELASLQRLPTLSQTFAESRKFGGCLVAAVQNFSQLKKIYRYDESEEISDLCNIRVYFRSPSTETARWVSKELGNNDLLESNEGISYGANTVRDGVSLSRQQHARPVVSENDVKNIENLSAYLKLPPFHESLSFIPLTKVKFDFKDRDVIANNCEFVSYAEQNTKIDQSTVITEEVTPEEYENCNQKSSLIDDLM